MQLLFKWVGANTICGAKKSPGFILAEQTVALMITSLVALSLVMFWGGVHLVKIRLNDQIMSARLLKEASDRYRDTKMDQNYQVDAYRVHVTKRQLQVSKHQRILMRVVRQ